MQVGIDRSMNALTNDSIDELEKLKTKYKIFEGPWLVSSVTSIMRPMYSSFR